MNSDNFIKIKQPNRATPKPQKPTQEAPPAEVEPTAPLEIEQPEQPAPAAQLESLAEVTPDQSVCGTGWSITQLLNEFSGR
ncbi:hypothetical protein [Aliterella atlantica]|uniref:Uncharacterized protein n=1 Tax=Aliterella atlantica CENA595 TaxID=1618023 RepID=A0A0D8ZMG5_9CYAN|nr:hypothetical protein [Aliterella atlantica]KJH69634.1 hypothetical protein UH38_22650 [Aliterella atlantica CENA595]